MKIFFFFKEASKSQMRLDDLGELQFLSLQLLQTIVILLKVCIVGFTRKACYAMTKYLRSVRYAKFEVCIGGRPPSASFHRAHRSHNGGDIVMLRLAEIQIPNSVLCATTIFLSFVKIFQFLLHDLSNQNQKPRLPHSVLKPIFGDIGYFYNMPKIQVHKTIFLA